jgi:photosystem I subunit 2
VFPEKVNSGRVGVNNKNFSIGKNTNPVKVKFTGKGTFDD